jgi:hypothetical protein
VRSLIQSSSCDYWLYGDLADGCEWSSRPARGPNVTLLERRALARPLTRLLKSFVKKLCGDWVNTSARHFLTWTRQTAQRTWYRPARAEGINRVDRARRGRTPSLRLIPALVPRWSPRATPSPDQPNTSRTFRCISISRQYPTSRHNPLCCTPIFVSSRPRWLSTTPFHSFRSRIPSAW